MSGKKVNYQLLGKMVNEKRDHREKIYISYDSTNKNCQAGDIELVEYGHPKDDKGLPVFNYSIACDTENKEPLFYEQYPGSVVDISQLQFMLEKAMGYGYKKVGFILDRGYFSKENIQYMGKRMLVCFTSKQRARQAKYNMTWDVAKARDLMNNMFNKENIMGIVFNPNDENMVIVLKELLLPIMPGEKPKPEFYRE